MFNSPNALHWISIKKSFLTPCSFLTDGKFTQDNFFINDFESYTTKLGDETLFSLSIFKLSLLDVESSGATVYGISVNH